MAESGAGLGGLEMRSSVRTIARGIASVPVVGPAASRARRLALRWITPFVIRHYLRTHAEAKLHLGAGGSGLPGWLNTDLLPERWPTVRLDATRPFRLPASRFSFVFSEHMIEHIPLPAGRNMLSEAHRVMRPGGRIRIATPDLRRVLQLYRNNRPEALSYLDWSANHNRLSRDLPADAVVINSLFHDHGHQFLYDQESLATALALAGFKEPRRCVPGESEHEVLRNLEIHGLVIGKEANEFETLVMEAIKP